MTKKDKNRDWDGTVLALERRMLSLLKVAAVTAGECSGPGRGRATAQRIWEEVRRSSATTADAFGWVDATCFMSWLFAKEGRKKLRLERVPEAERRVLPRDSAEWWSELECYRIVINSIDDSPVSVTGGPR